MAAESTAELEYTPVADIPGIVARARTTFCSRLLATADQRKGALRAFHRLVTENQDALIDAVHRDIGRSRAETALLEVMTTTNEIVYQLDHLDDLMKPETPSLEGIMRVMNCRIHRDPLGVVLIISPWNYPVQLALLPIAGALAAGNTVIVKPSELAPACAALIASLMPRYLPAGVVTVVNGAVPETTALLKERYDHILYTGGGAVAKLVMTAAAQHLTPVTLELGGKSPAIVDPSSEKKIADVAARVLWGKYVNAGQTCIAPDYVLIHRSVKPRFVEAFRAARENFMSNGGGNPLNDTCYSNLINDRHFARVQALMKGGTVVVGGEADPARRRIAPTLLDDVDLESPLMTEEIFGPLLPMVVYDTLEEAIAFVNARPKPLALYVFAEDHTVVEAVTSQTSSGGVVVNHVLVHAGVEGLPFGGVGPSGMGCYHSQYSFECFSHRKSVLTLPLSSALNPVVFPPYDEKRMSWMLWAMTKKEGSWLKRALFGGKM